MSVASAKSRILVVADDVAVVQLVTQQLLALGHDIAAVATQGQQALDLAAELQPDLVLIALELAGAMDGMDAAQAIRARFPLPLVFLSAFDADARLERANFNQPFGYVLLPCTQRELGAIVAMALYKHQAEAALVSNTRQMKVLGQRVLAAQESERRRVAVELHDELGQSLTALKINLQLRARFRDSAPAELDEENLRIVDDALQQVRRLAMGLRPSLLDDLGLVPALQWMAEQNAGRGAFALRFDFDKLQSRLPPEIETAFFRVAQEALTNIVRHSRAQHVAVGLRHDADRVILRVQDDGGGFDLAEMRARAALGASLGVLGMQERAALLGGRLDIQSTPGEGSVVRLSCPWRERVGAP